MAKKNQASDDARKGSKETSAAPETAAAKPDANAETVKIETVAEVATESAKTAVEEKVTTLSEHVVTAAKAAQDDANHATHGVLENFLVHLTEFKAKIAAVEDEIEGEAANLLSRIKAIL